jgi:hypothetical protein
MLEVIATCLTCIASVLTIVYLTIVLWRRRW